jgi:hypothetical protein
MNHELGPPRRGLLPQLPLDVNTQIVRIEYVIFTRADCALAWRTFSDLSLWPTFSDLYDSIRWQGSPWTPGSRLRLEIRPPFQTVVDRVITVCMPPRHVGWISHVRGYTMEQLVSFDPYPGGGTRISTWIEMTGADLFRDEGKDVKTVKTLLADWFDKFGRECDRGADGDNLGLGHSPSSK